MSKNSIKLNAEMREYAKTRFIVNIEEVFEDFKLYYQSKEIVISPDNLDKLWKRWVLNFNKFRYNSNTIQAFDRKKYLLRKTIDNEVFYVGDKTYYKEFKNIKEYIDEFGIKHYLVELKNKDIIEKIYQNK